MQTQNQESRNGFSIENQFELECIAGDILSEKKVEFFECEANMSALWIRIIGDLEYALLQDIVKQVEERTGLTAKNVSSWDGLKIEFVEED